MQSKHRPVLQRMSLVGAVGAVALLGNMRASGSQEGAGASVQSHAVGSGSQIAVDGRLHRKALDSRDDGQLVPAIFAWDPDVRFVYYRHISKWM